MKYKIYYSLPYDIHLYNMDAKDEEQLGTFVKMLAEEKAYRIEVVPETNGGWVQMEGEKILITWKTKLDDGYIDERQIVCKSKTSAKILCNRLAALDKTVAIEMEYLTND